MRLLTVFFLFVAACCITACSTNMPPDVQQAYAQLPKKLDYNLHVKPILSDKCFSCHGPDKNKQQAGLRLDIAEYAYDELPESPGKYAIEPGSPDGSEVYHRILSADPDVMMPTPASHRSLSAYEKAVLIKWIEQGAKYQPHWAFVAPTKPGLPDVDNSDWTINNPIDNFILDRLQQEKLSPAKEAPKEILLRRLYLDLIGLPPTPAQTDSFLHDASANAYEKQVDKLLASPQYGERMATDWLDLARFADSHGYTVDRLRDMSPYRNWVINAFNNNMHYDEFVTQQLAGDLMPHPTKDMLIATAFNRNHAQNTEGGIVEEEFQTEYVVDRTNTFGNAFLGLTVGCAKCHDHKYDPFTQKNYYELFGFFNNVKEAGQIAFSDAMPTPTMLLPTAEKEKVLAFIKHQIDEQSKKVDAVVTNARNDFNAWLQQKKYKSLAIESIPKAGLQANINFEKKSLSNTLRAAQKGTMLTETARPGAAPVFVNGFAGKGLQLDGDTWLNIDGVGIFCKSDPFTISIRVMIPKELKEGVIFHKSQAERLYNFRGYHLYLKNNRLELTMAHTAPSDAITKTSIDTIPRDQWMQLTVSYDGSSKASGLNLYMNGEPMTMKTEVDALTKDILFESNNILTSHGQPSLQIGAWWRGLGFKGGKVDDILVYNRKLSDYEIAILAGKKSWNAIVAKEPSAFTAAETQALQAYYLSVQNASFIEANAGLQNLRKELADSTENIQELMVMREMPEPKKTYILRRGNYDMPGEEVHPDAPEFLLPFNIKLPKNRLGLSQWLMDKNNPLTARVEVNRLWQQFFGTGIVKTSEDFGNQGELPSHKELLDWLAVTFIESGWDIKKLCKLMVMSATYRQSSVATKELRERDPYNRLLARGPSGRMPAEMIRDNALKAAGLLNETIGGKSVKPYQPDGLWEINNTSYTRDSGDAVYRRSLYVIVKRSVPNPTLGTFDAGSRSYCITRRQTTNTPLQALVTLNDPTFVEACAALGEQMSQQKNVAVGIVLAYRKLTGQTPSKQVLDLLLQEQQMQQQKFAHSPQKAKGFLQAGQYTVSDKANAALVAANAVVANTILNSDACITKR